ncbi:MAG: AAA family ATPase [Blastocatellia bacterium]
MHITKIELENIKSHADATFEFSRGSTAITGENGAGKTTIIEAIAWTLFDLLSYKKDEFVRRGEKKGSVRVTLESGLDEREYTVYRDTGTGYYVYDPALKTRIADKKEEVTRFLWQHLGVEPGTDLESLFKHAIGVPQGTFTAIFLATAAERKKTFDTLLKVEDYRRGADELLKTSRYIERQITLVDIKIARAEGEISRIGSVEEEHKAFASQTAELSRFVDELENEIVVKQLQVKVLDDAEEKLNAAMSEVEKLRAEKSRAEIILAQYEADLTQSRNAAAKITQVRADAERHSQALARMNELERERIEREKLKVGLAKVEAAIVAVKADQKHLQQDLENIQKSHAAIESLKGLIADQERLEKEVEKLRNDYARAQASVNQIKSLDDKIERLRESYRANSAQLNVARKKGLKAAGLETLQNRDTEIVRELANLQAALDRDERFQKEIKNGLCPILSQKCLNLKEGETLEGFVTSQFGELKSRISVLQTEHAQVSSALKTSQEGAKFLTQIATLENRETEISDEGKRLNDEKAVLEKESENLSRIRTHLQRTESDLKALDNPKGKIAILEKEAGREIEIREKLSNIEKNTERLESDRRIFVEQLEKYKDLDRHWTETTEMRDRTSESNRIFIANEALAIVVLERELKLENAKQESSEIQKRLIEAEKKFETLSKNYDRERHLFEKEKFIELQKNQAEARATLEAARKREAELAAELERLQAIRKSMQDEFREKERLEKVAEATDFIRTTLKEAAPLVARNYVYHVSLEANQMFREITGNAERTLKWAEDYGIILEESGYDRLFVSLSGGEQMAAALSVRLAMLKQLSDIRIAFFDEPTTNMDAERRENLAMQIGQIRHFDQLFVISHDDTFEGYMDNEIHVGD